MTHLGDLGPQWIVNNPDWNVIPIVGTRRESHFDGLCRMAAIPTDL